MSAPKTASEIIEHMFKRVRREKHQSLVDVQGSRALGALMAMCDLQLIDGPTYTRKSQELHALEKARTLKLSGVAV